MRERPILFSGPMVRAILDGRKTQTRRVIAGNPVDVTPFRGRDGEPTGEFGLHSSPRVISKHVRCPYGVPGDQLWVRESFWAKHDTDSDGYSTIDCGPCLDIGAEHHPGIQYVATPENPECPTEPGDWWEAPPEDWDGASDYLGKGEMVWLPWTKPFSKHPSIHMPRWASRLSLEITEVRVERLQDIDGDDVLSEGFRVDGAPIIRGARVHSTPKLIEGFAAGWDQINGKRPGASWAANPWVWVVGFRRLEGPQLSAG